MNNRIKILLVCTIGFCLVGCSPYNKLIKSNDHEKMYNAAIEYYKNQKNDKALFIFDLVSPYFAGSVREDSILFFSAVCNYRMGDFVTSIEQLNEFKLKFNRSTFIEEAEFLIGMSWYNQSPIASRDQTPSLEAIRAFNEYLARYPDSKRSDECRNKIAELTQKLYDKALLNAEVYYNIEYYKSAIHALKTSLMDYPETTHRQEILYLITVASYRLAENSIPDLQYGRYLDTMDAYYNLVSEFPETIHLKDATRIYNSVQKVIKKSEEKEEKELKIE